MIRIVGKNPLGSSVFLWGPEREACDSAAVVRTPASIRRLLPIRGMSETFKIDCVRYPYTLLRSTVNPIPPKVASIFLD